MSADRLLVHRQQEVNRSAGGQDTLLGDTYLEEVMPTPDARHIVGHTDSVQAAAGQDAGEALAVRFHPLAGRSSEEKGHLIYRHG